MSKAYEHKPQNAGKKKNHSEISYWNQIARENASYREKPFLHAVKNDREIDFKGVKWEREDGPGVKAENLKVEVKEGCKKQNIIIIYEIYESGKKKTTKSIILFIELAATTYLNANFPTNFCLHPILCMP